MFNPLFITDLSLVRTIPEDVAGGENDRRGIRHRQQGPGSASFSRECSALLLFTRNGRTAIEENLSPGPWKAMHEALDVDLTEDLRESKPSNGPGRRNRASGKRRTMPRVEELRGFACTPSFEVIRGSNGNLSCLSPTPRSRKSRHPGL